jgi:hypothetical protein
MFSYQTKPACWRILQAEKRSFVFDYPKIDERSEEIVLLPSLRGPKDATLVAQ